MSILAPDAPLVQPGPGGPFDDHTRPDPIALLRSLGLTVKRASEGWVEIIIAEAPAPKGGGQ